MDINISVETITPEHVKAARAFLRWNAQDLAGHCSVGVATVRRYESGGHIRDSSKQAILDGLINAGIELKNGGQPSVKLLNKAKVSG